MRALSWLWTHPANRGRRVAALTHAVHVQLLMRLTGRPVPTPLGRTTLLAERGFRASTKVVYANPPDWAEMQAWQRILKPGDLFVDVGANVGAYTLWASACGAEVIAVEPHPPTVERLRRNIRLNGFDVEVVALAVADRPGRRRMTSDLDAENRLLPTDRGGVGVPVTTLDVLLGGRTAAGLKIDVEGAEELVLRGARRALADQRIRVIQLEWNERSEAKGLGRREGLAELLGEAGYHFCRPDQHGRLIACDFDRPGDDVFAVLPGAGPW